jgi:hypothetical protein
VIVENEQPSELDILMGVLKHTVRTTIAYAIRGACKNLLRERHPAPCPGQKYHCV